MDPEAGMQIPNAAHRARPWRIHEIAGDFRLEDVWALPIHGGAEDLPQALALVGRLDPADSDSVLSTILWAIRDLLGRVGLGRVRVDGGDPGAALPIPGTDETTLTGRLPRELRGTADDVDFGRLPFVPLYRTDDEFAAEISNTTVHGVLHLAWAEQGRGRFQAQMAVYVKPRGRLGEGYMALIRPFRHRIVYPALMRQIERAWTARPAAS
jgi:hypothetical protein